MEFDFDLENPLLLTCCDNISLLFSVESDHMPSKSYLQRLGDEETGSCFSSRCEIISFIHRFSRNFDSFVSYLAVNYMDRFLSTQPTLDHQKPWIFKLVAVSCVSLALKMSKTEFHTSDLIKSGIFDSLTVGRMEMLILSALKWRMRSINPFSFLGFYISSFELKDRASAQLLRSKAVEIIFKAQPEIKLLEFNPSTISASALLCAADEVCPLLLPYMSEAISGCEYVNKENLFVCYDVMREEVAAINGVGDDDESSSCTPANVFESKNTRILLFSEINAISYDRNRPAKRPKLGNFNI